MNRSQKIKENIRTFLGRTGFYFTIVTVLINTVLSIAFPSGDKAVLPSTFIWFFLFSAIFSLCDFIFQANFIESYAAKAVIHFVLVTMDFAIVMAWLTDRSRSMKSIVFAVLIFAVFFLAVDIIRAVIHYAVNKKANANKEYSSVFSDEHK